MEIILGLIVVSLPFIIVGVVFVAIFAIVAFFALFEVLVLILLRGPRYWLLTLYLIIDSILLVPLWALILLSGVMRTDDWQEISSGVYTFTLILVSATTIQYVYCKFRDKYLGVSADDYRI